VPHKNGRPPIDHAPSVPVCLRVSSAAYDQLYALAGRHGVSVPEAVRRVLARRLPPRSGGDDDDREED
jgi:hypothetical protein